MAYRPIIGDSGFFTLKEPYSVLLTPTTLYTCQSVRTVNDFIASGESVYEKFYAPLKVSGDEYQQDLAENVLIVGLQAGTGEWVYVPSSFIVDAPTSNGVKYIPVVLGISLGAIPDAYNLEGIIKQVTDIVTNTLGITPEVKGLVVSSPKWLTNEEHELLETSKKALISNSTSSIILAKILQSENDRLREVILQYEKIFKMTISTGQIAPP